MGLGLGGSSNGTNGTAGGKGGGASGGSGGKGGQGGGQPSGGQNDIKQVNEKMNQLRL